MAQKNGWRELIIPAMSQSEQKSSGYGYKYRWPRSGYYQHRNATNRQHLVLSDEATGVEGL